MSLAERLKRIERKQADHEQRIAALESAHGALVDALEDEADDEPDDSPTLDLDGNSAGGERDQSLDLG